MYSPNHSEKQSVKQSSGYLHLELIFSITMIVITAMIVSSLFIVRIRRRSGRLQCIANLKELYMKTSIYIEENGGFPDIDSHSERDGTLFQGLLKIVSPNQSFLRFCPAIEDPLKGEYLVWAKTVRDIRSMGQIPRKHSSKLLFLDPIHKAHGQYSNAVSVSGKIIQFISPPGSRIPDRFMGICAANICMDGQNELLSFTSTNKP